MAKTYYLQFGSANPASFTGLTPTFTIFSANGISAQTAPGITETPSGSGLYRFQYFPTFPIIFVADGGAALSSSDRFVTGTLDPAQAVDEQIGTIADSFGSTSTDPTTIWGHTKRNQEFNEGNAIYTKSTGTWDISSRGSSTLLRSKTLANNASTASKS